MIDPPEYPKIPFYSQTDPPWPERNKPCVAFEKYDGTNLSWYWNRELGWVDSRTRRRSFGENDPDFGAAIKLFEQLKSRLETIFNTYPILKESDDIVIYTEFLGNDSFAGLHKPKDEKYLKIIDTWNS